MIPPLSGIRSQQDYEAFIASERGRLDREHNVVHDPRELIGWEILHLERFKPGVVVFHARKRIPSGMDFQSGFAKDSIFRAWQLPS